MRLCTSDLPARRVRATDGLGAASGGARIGARIGEDEVSFVLGDGMSCADRRVLATAKSVLEAIESKTDRCERGLQAARPEGHRQREITMKKFIHTALFTTAAGALTFGAAASLDLRAENLGAGATSVASCDPDGVDVAWGFVENEPELVGFIYVRDLSPECYTQTINVSVSSSESAVLATGTAVVSVQNALDATVLVDLSSDIQAAQIHEVSVTITGAPSGAPVSS